MFLSSIVKPVLGESRESDSPSPKHDTANIDGNTPSKTNNLHTDFLEFLIAGEDGCQCAWPVYKPMDLPFHGHGNDV